jgi:hypothetical protein
MNQMSYTITQANMNKDRSDIIGLLKNVFSEAPEERLSWIYQNNPQGAAACWLARTSADNRLIGATTLFARRLWIDGAPHLVGVAGDFAVVKEHRAFGPALALKKAALSGAGEGEFDLIYSFPNSASRAVLLRAGYATLGRVARFTRLLKSRSYFQKRCRPAVLAPVLGAAVDAAMSCRYEWFGGWETADYLGEEVDAFDERFDALWQEARRGHRIIGERTRRFLRWRFAESPHHAYKTFASVRKSDRRLTGYIVYYDEGDVVCIADLLSSDQEGSLLALLRGFLRHQEERGKSAVYVLYLGDGFLVRALSKVGFLERPERSEVLYHATSALRPTVDIARPENWYLFEGDNDI